MTAKTKSRTDRALYTGGDEPADMYFSSRARSCDHKTRQLCAQVQRSLAFLLETECSEPCLQGLCVEQVIPYPNAGRLMVTLRQWDGDRVLDLAAVLEQLAQRKGYWRGQIGRAIHRKRTPDLAFQVLLAGAGQ